MSARRMLKNSVRELANIVRSSKAGQTKEHVSDPKPAATSKTERLFRRAKLEADKLITEGHTARLEHCASLMQLAYTYIDVVHIQDRAELAGEMAQALELIHAVGTNDPDAPVESSTPLAFVCSYPRSGNTVAMQLAAQTLQAQVLEGMPNSMFPFSKRIYPKHYPFVRLIKDHEARAFYKHDRVALIVRDGRDCMISLAFMTLKNGGHFFAKRHELANFIRWLDKDYPFGGWAKYMRDASHLAGFENKYVMRYEDFMAGPQAFIDLVRFLDPEHRFTDAGLTRGYETRHLVFDGVKNNPAANRSWGIGAEFEPDSLFYEWSQNRKGSSWRQSWDKEAKKAFHETGATDFLIEYGYETDPDWWKV